MVVKIKLNCWIVLSNLDKTYIKSNLMIFELFAKINFQIIQIFFSNRLKKMIDQFSNRTQIHTQYIHYA